MNAYKSSLYQDERGHFRARIQATNGRIIFASSEGYENKDDCLQNLVDIATAIATIGVNGFTPCVEVGKPNDPFEPRSGSPSPSSV
jgi:uncharacterized protein YegP (UPF0339 family)